MRGTLYLFRSEMKRYLTSPFAYLIAAAVLVVTGVLYAQDIQEAISRRAPSPSLIPQAFAFLLVFFAPLITMRLLAEEKREGTMELLLTAPIDETTIVFGKFLGAWAYFSLILLLTLLYQIATYSLLQPDLGHTLCAYIGIWLYGGAALAVGIVFSAITENQIVAAFLGMIVLMLLWLGNSVGNVIQNIEIARVVRLFTLQGHFASSFAVGLVRAEDVAFYAGIIVVMLFAATRIVGAQRWQ